jgi:cobalt-zinc-cadmium efflux system membrane fusion protein
MNNAKKYVYALLVILISMSCRKSNNDQEVSIDSSKNDKIIGDSKLVKVSIEQFQSENMKLVSMEELPFPSHIRTTGMIDVPPSSKAVISAYIGGYIKNTPLLIGDKVKKGQALVTLENLDFIQMQQEYLEVSEQLTYLKSEYERQKVLYNEKISSKKNYLKAESNFKKANAQYSGLHKKLKLLNIDPNLVSNGKLTSVSTIFAPISGSITKVGISSGTYISPADKIMEIINTDHIHIELRVFEKDILKIKKGQKVSFRIPESSNENFEGEIHLIGKSIDENRTVKVHAHIDDHIKQNFLVGMFVEADIVISDKMANSLPEDAIVDINEENYVLVFQSKDKDSYTFIKKKLKTGNTYNRYTELINTNFLGETDQFLIGGFNLISAE